LTRPKSPLKKKKVFVISASREKRLERQEKAERKRGSIGDCNRLEGRGTSQGKGKNPTEVGGEGLTDNRIWNIERRAKHLQLRKR